MKIVMAKSVVHMVEYPSTTDEFIAIAYCDEHRAIEQWTSSPLASLSPRRFKI